MPRVPITVSRRRVLVGAAGLALAGVAGTACGSTPPVKDVDALMGQLERARIDDGLARAAATGAAPGPAKALTAVAAERAAHAVALTDEITRVSGEAPPAETPPSSAQTSTPGSATGTTPGPSTTNRPPPPPTRAEVVASLQQSAAGAALVAAQQSGYRAGLLGSIAAACTAAATVALADPRAAS